MIVNDILQRRVPSLREHSLLSGATDVLVESGLGSLPVLDATGRLTGVVSEGDILRFAVQRREPTGAPVTGTDAYRQRAARHVVSDVMTRHPVTVSERQSVEDVARLFVRLPWRVLPVIRRGRLAGVGTRTAVVSALVCQAEPSTDPLAGSPR